MIITTNLSLEEMKHPQTRQQARLFDRLLERCIPIRINGQNSRQQKAKANLQIARELLGGNG